MFRRLDTYDLSVEDNLAIFSTQLKTPSLFAVGLATMSGRRPSGGPAPYVPIPLKCIMYVVCPTDSDQYLTSADIMVYVAMKLPTVQLVRGRRERERERDIYRLYTCIMVYGCQVYAHWSHAIFLFCCMEPHN